MNCYRLAAALWCVVALSTSDAYSVQFDWVTVGDAGNASNRVDDQESLSPVLRGREFGTVDDSFRMGKFEVTVGQYVDFLNAVAVEDTNGLYTFWMDANIDEPYSEGDGPRGGIRRDFEPGSHQYTVQPGYANQPVIFTSFLDAARFANWLHNGQLAGAQGLATTEDGAYTLTPSSIANNTVSRNPGAKFFVPSLDEWYKSAYYKGGGEDAGYWTYPTQSDSPPNATMPPGGANSANYAPLGPSEPHPAQLAAVGSYVNTPGPYGTFDQAGNVWEWTEWSSGSDDTHLIIGGDVHDPADSLSSTLMRVSNAGIDQDLGAGTNCCSVGGFRLASVAVPTGSITTSADISYTVSSDLATTAARATAHAEPQSSMSGGFVGELDSDDAHALTRLISKFTLPTVPDNESLEGLQSAELRFYVEAIHGAPVGAVSVYHSATENDRLQSATDYDDPSFVDTGLDLVQPSDAAPAYYQVDVTDWVVADYQSDRGLARSAFRLQADGAVILADSLSHGYQFAVDGVMHGPELILHFVPEPATSLLASIAWCCGLLVRRW